MKKIRSVQDLNQFREEIIEEQKRVASLGKARLVVGLGSCGIAVGALDVLHAIEAHVKADHLNEVIVSQTGCIGLCSLEPILEVTTGDGARVTYGKVTPAIVDRILREHVLGGKVVQEFVIDTTPFPTI
ncbi:MAG TPA: (2Fe-2S) ferredoxin domain-containing protein [Anaerolineales bacterium]|nr:(2Fe-2S) ferredoxin domain-containing protein [Anaerolineales bacterium]